MPVSPLLLKPLFCSIAPQTPDLRFLKDDLTMEQAELIKQAGQDNGINVQTNDFGDLEIHQLSRQQGFSIVFRSSGESLLMASDASQ